MITKKFLHYLRDRKAIMLPILLCLSFLIILPIISIGVMFLAFTEYALLKPCIISLQFFSCSEVYIFLSIILVVLFLLKRAKFTTAIIVSFLVPSVSPLTFIWLEIHLYKRKKWLWFWHAMASYLAIWGYCYIFFKLITKLGQIA